MRMQELLIIFAILLLLFGATRLPQLGSSLGSAIRTFKKGFGGAADEPEVKGESKNVASIASSSDATDATRAKTPSKES